MAVMSNRESISCRQSLEMDINAVCTRPLWILPMQTSQRTRFWTSSIRKTEKVHIHW